MSDEHSTAIEAAEVGIVEHTSQEVHPLARAVMSALTSDPSPETIREIMMLQRDWEKGEAEKSFNRDFVALQAAVPRVLKRDKIVSFTSKRTRETTSYRHTTLSAAMDELADKINAHNFAVLWLPQVKENKVRVTCRLMHRDGHCIETALDSPPDTSGHKSPSQGIASTITLLERYTLLAVLGIVTRDQVEPEGRENGNKLAEPMRVQKALVKMNRAGITQEEAEYWMEKPANEWTAVDLVALWKWMKSQAPESEDE